MTGINKAIYCISRCTYRCTSRVEKLYVFAAINRFSLLRLRVRKISVTSEVNDYNL